MDLHITGTSPGSLLPIFIVIANKSKAEANSRFFNMNGRLIVMKSTDKFVLVLVASLSLLFAGCGGGGGSSSDEDVQPPVTTPDPETHEVDISALPTEYNTIPEGTYEIESGTTMDVGDHVTFSCPAGDMGCSVEVTVTETTGDDGVTVTTTAVTSTGGAATIASSQAVIDKIEMARLDELRAMTHDVDMGGIAESYGPTPGTYDIAPGEMADAGNVDFSCSMAAEVNCMVIVADDGSVTNTGGMASAAQSEAGIAAIKKDEEDAENARLARMKAEAMRVAGMIGPSATLADYDGPGTTGTADQIVSFNATGMPVFEGDPASETSTDPRFTKLDDAPASIAGWEGGTYTRTTVTGGVTNMDTVVKYNDKAPNTAAMYSTYFDGSTELAARGYGSISSGVISLTNGDATNPVMDELYSINFGLTAAHQTLPIVHDNPDTTTVEDSTSYTGSFTGVPGTFTCTNTCSVSSDKDGALSYFVGTWTFTPDGIKDPRGGNLTGDALTAAQMRIMVAGVVPDPDFMILGYWMRTSTAADGEVTHSMRPIYDGLRDYANVSSVLGTATYTGPATGLYMSKSLTPDGQPTDPFASGQFTADARLNANFGGGEVALNHAFSISGTISNFRDGGDEAINSQWVVNLNRRMIGTNNDEPQRNVGDLTTAGHRDGTSGTFDGVTDGGALGSAAGSWSGLFHGADDTATTAVEQPASVSGMFDGHFSNGHVRGSFAANNNQ